MTYLTIRSHDGGSFRAYVATPRKKPAAALILIQEIFGVNDVMRATADHYAALGYLTLCPDLFWRQEPDIEISDKTEEHWARAFELFQGFDTTLGIEDLRATLTAARVHANGTGRAGCVGYCLGGKLAYLMATRTDVDASVSYYGVGLDDLLSEGKHIKKPLLMHMAANDKFVSPDAQKKIIKALTPNKKVQLFQYEAVDHAFARLDGVHYDEGAATLANGRTAEFLKKNLK